MFTVESRVDTSGIIRGMQGLDAILDAACRGGLADAGKALMDDTVDEMPGTPILTSALRGSGSVYVSGALSSISDHGIPTYQAGPDGAERRVTDRVAEVLFNAPYAWVQHEMYPVKRVTGCGMKYLEMKIYGNAYKYISILTDGIRNRFTALRVI